MHYAFTISKTVMEAITSIKSDTESIEQIRAYGQMGMVFVEHLHST